MAATALEGTARKPVIRKCARTMSNSGEQGDTGERIPDLVLKNMKPLTLAQARQLYIAGTNDYVPVSTFSASEWKEIHAEMQRIVDAPSARQAAKVIKWWGCWDRNYTMTAFARRVREAAKKL